MSKAATLSAARKLSTTRAARWVDGPVCAADELKIWEIELADLLTLVAAVERAAPSTRHAAQWLRRMFYSTPLGGAGGGFDRFITTLDTARTGRPMTTADVPQSVLDSLVRVGSVRIPGAVAPLDRVEMSHVFVLLDLRLNGRSGQGGYFDGVTGLLEFILSWLGDVASAWLGFQKEMLVAKAAAGTAWAEPLTPAGLATPLGWLDTGIRGRAPIDDLLGDLDAVVLARKALPTGTDTPIATMLAEYYTVGVPSTGAVARVDDRFPQFVTRALPEIPHVAGAGGITLTPDAQQWLRAVIHEGVLLLLVFSRAGTSKAKIATATPGVILELESPWSSAMIDELAQRFFTFLSDGLAGRAVSWPAQPTTAVAYPGYEWLMGAPPALPGTPAVDELEAVAQFHLNWRQPHRPLRLTDRLWRPLVLRDPSGPTATPLAGAPAGSTRFEVDPFVDLTGVRVSAPGSEHADLLRLDGDTARAGRSYRIVAVDPAARTITVEGVPSVGAFSPWQVLRRPRLVLVEPFGGRIGGAAASTTAVPAGWVQLDGIPDLNAVRANFDTIALAGDKARPSRSYRIVAVHPTDSRVQLDATPSPTAGTGWRIPAGYADLLNPLVVTLTPTAAGCDTYDGLLFVVHDDTVQGSPLPFTGYSSTVNAADPVLGTSITGNARYAVRSLRSPDSEARNYEFAVTDPDKLAQDLVATAGHYLDNVTALRQPPAVLPGGTARPDPDGKTAIRIHVGNATGTVAGSTGDLVSPAYRTLRTLLVGLHQTERALLGLAPDPALTAVAGATTQAASTALYNGGTVTDTHWNDRLHADLYLVRPDLRPTTP